MKNAINLEHRVVVGGGAGCFEATALIDGDIDQHGPFLHSGQHLARNKLRGFGARKQDRANDGIRLLRQLTDSGRRGHQQGAIFRQGLGQGT